MLVVIAFEPKMRYGRLRIVRAFKAAAFASYSPIGVKAKPPSGVGSISAEKIPLIPLEAARKAKSNDSPSIGWSDDVV